MPNVPYPYEVNWHLVTGNGSLIPICSLSNHFLSPSLLYYKDFHRENYLFCYLQISNDKLLTLLLKTYFQNRYMYMILILEIEALGCSMMVEIISIVASTNTSRLVTCLE